MERRYPDHLLETLDEVYSELVGGLPEPWAGINMVASLDGAVTLQGRSGGLAGPGDRAAFRALRDAADVVLVGATTARVEGYRVPRPRRDHVAARRRAAGQEADVRIAVVTRSLDLDGARLLPVDPTLPPPIVLAPGEADPERVATLRAAGADVVLTGAAAVDLPAAFTALRERGLGRVLVEGGAVLNRQVLTDGLIDDLFVTIAPLVVGGDEQRLVDGALARALPLEVASLRMHESELYLRYRVADGRSR